MGRTDPKTIRPGINNVLKPRFGSVVALDSLDDVKIHEVDMTVVMDVGVTIGRGKLAKTIVEVRGVFRDVAGNEFDQLSGNTTVTLPFMNPFGNSMFYEAYPHLSEAKRNRHSAEYHRYYCWGGKSDRLMGGGQFP
tara:strand:- start:202 stop:609 length:408 start_codon:yes stop_codon:yes gene_type:complete